MRFSCVLLVVLAGCTASHDDLGEAQYGVTLISEMLPNKGVTVWPLPDDLQMTTIYTAAVATNAENAMDAALLLNDLRGPRGREASIQAGLKPVSN